jgi:UDP-galactopyranose mutase
MTPSRTTRRSTDAYLVVGAGITGMSAALLLARRGHDVTIWEAGDRHGGILAPVEFQGLELDRGSHRVHPESHPLLRELTAREQWEERPRNGKLVLNGGHIPYPINPVSFLRGLGLETAVDMGVGWLTRPGVFRRFLSWEDARQQTPDDDRGFETFVVERVGESAYRQFYRPYVDKVWGQDPDDISQSVAKQRVSTSDPMKTILRSLGLEKQSFLYPTGGMAGLMESLREQLDEYGVEIEYERSYDVERDARDGSGAPEGFDTVLFSGHLSDLVPDSDLGHRGLYLLHLAFDRDVIDDTVDTWYIPETEYWFGRVSQPENFSVDFAREGQSVICVEIPEGRWGPDVRFDERLDELTAQLVDAGILEQRASPVEVAQTFLPRIYPNYVRHWYHAWEETLDRVRQLGDVLPIGRQGLFLHCNMDHCVAIADDAVEHATGPRANDAWFDRCPDYLDLRVRD